MNYDISTYLTPQDVPRYLKDYVRYGMYYFNQVVDRLHRSIQQRKALIEEFIDDVEAVELNTDILEGLYQSIRWLDETRDSFVDDALCNVAHISIDFGQYHKDQALKCYETIDSMEALKPKADSEQLKLIEASIQEQRRFAEGHLSRANVPGFKKTQFKQVKSQKELAAIQELIQELENE
jgi:hypothetical protein